MYNQDLVNEINEFIDILSKSGFFSNEEILEILEDEFIGEEIDFSQFNICPNKSDNKNFIKLKNVFNGLSAENNILTVHNCGYNIIEGVEDIFELYLHLRNNNFDSSGFCFYTFEDVEEAIFDNKLKITFGDFKKDESIALEIGEIVLSRLKENDFDAVWDGSVNSQIEIHNFNWDKSYDNSNYNLEGAFEMFTCGELNEC